MSKHEITGGEYTTVDGITYSISPQGPGTKLYSDKLVTRPECPVWRRGEPL